ATSSPSIGRRRHRLRKSVPAPLFFGRLHVRLQSGDRRSLRADGTGCRCPFSTWRIAPFGRFWQARHPPRYAAFNQTSSPRFTHSSLSRAGRQRLHTSVYGAPVGEATFLVQSLHRRSALPECALLVCSVPQCPATI